MEKDLVVDLEGKVKFPEANVVYCGERDGAISYLMDNGGKGYAIVYSTLTGGNRSTLTGGDYSTLTGGNRSTLTGGNRSTLTGGDYSTLTGGNRSTLTGGDYSTLTGGDYSTLTGGDYSTLTGGEKATLIFKRWNGKRYKFYIAYVGEDGIKESTAYRLNTAGEFEECTE
ncbi:hypothetical protein ACI2JR_15725 [Klebsiella sp. NPDC088457]